MFCLTDEKGVVPAEISLARVSLANGVEEVATDSHCVEMHELLLQVYHELVHPGPLPLGYRADCIYNASKTHKIPLDMVGRCRTKMACNSSYNS